MASELTATEIADGPELSWLVRPCEQYRDELRECKMWRSRFHQYFIHGRKEDCTQFNTDYRNCIAFRQSRDPALRDAIVASERIRVRARLSGHLNNDVWEHRDSPPEDWTAPLPDNLRERTETSTLTTMVRDAQEAEKDPSKSEASVGSSCCIS